MHWLQQSNTSLKCFVCTLFDKFDDLQETDLLNLCIVDPVDSKWVILGCIGREAFSCCSWLNWPCDIFTILNMHACHQVFISTVFTVSRVELRLPQPLGLYQSSPNSRLLVSVLMYSICLESCTSSRLHSGPFGDISGSRLTYGEDCRNTSEAARLRTSDPQMCRYILSSNRLCHRGGWALRRESS